MGCRVEGAERDQGRVPEVRGGADECVRPGHVWMVLLDCQERQQPLGSGVDDQKWIHLVERLARAEINTSVLLGYVMIDLDLQVCVKAN